MICKANFNSNFPLAPLRVTLCRTLLPLWLNHGVSQSTAQGYTEVGLVFGEISR
jgi:hypothetical protein